MNQEEWDHLLVESFYLRPDCPMWRIYWDDGDNLKRTPRRFLVKMTVCGFICSFLPKLANILWRSDKKSIDKIARSLSKSKYDVEEASANRGFDSLMAVRRQKERINREKNSIVCGYLINEKGRHTINPIKQHALRKNRRKS